MLLRKRIGRHIRHCSVCGERQRRELSPIALFSVLPVAALPGALRHRVLGLITDGSPGAVAQRLAVGQRACPLGPGGFPHPLDPPSPVRPHHLTRSAVARGGAAVGGAAIAGGALVGGGLLHPAPHPPGTSPAPPAIRTPVTGESSPSGGGGGSGGAGDGATSPGPRVLRTGTAAPSTAPAGPGGGGPPSPSASADPSPAISAVVAGTLTVSPPSLGLKLSLGSLWTGTLTLTATGGPVPGYHVTVPAPLLKDLTLSQASGSLAAGQSVHIQVTAVSAALFSTALLTVNPGGLSVPVTYQLLG